MGWQTLLAEFRASLSTEGLCHSCGHPFENERDLQIEHREPPRHAQDWARQHAKNIALLCGSCNNTKRDKPFAIWLDEQEEARVANERHRKEASLLVPSPSAPIQMTFDDVLEKGAIA
jgi:hypothetical protein